jgi:trehalose 6-phosphate phosphatase
MAADPLAPLRDAPGRSALVFDVDGTLAPIAPRPELAVVPPETRAELERLASRYLLLAFISGRPGAEAERIVGIPGARYVGNHGLELDARARALVPAIEAFRDSVARDVEDKGLTQAREAGLVPRWGRKVLEIRPDFGADKGTAVLALVRESGAGQALYAGDDTTDPLGLTGAADLVVPGPEALVVLLTRL